MHLGIRIFLQCLALILSAVIIMTGLDFIRDNDTLSVLLGTLLLLVDGAFLWNASKVLIFRNLTITYTEGDK